MVASDVQRTRYAVFVRFRRSRLVLRRGFTDLTEAIAVAQQLRGERLHGRDDIFILRQPDGEVISVPANGANSPADPPASLAPLAEVEPLQPPAPPERVHSLIRIDGEPVAEPRVDRMRRAVERARTARARAELALAAMERQLDSEDDTGELAHLRAQLHTVHEETSRAIGSFEAVTALVERRLERA